MRVGLDLHTLAGVAQGSRTYMANLAMRLPAMAPHIRFTFYVPDPAAPAARELVHMAGDPANVALAPIPAGRLARLAAPFPARLSREVDVFHCQYLGPFWCRAGVVVSIHDILHETRPEFYPRGLSRLMRLLYPIGARRAARVLTISRFSLDEILARYRVDPTRAGYAHLGVGEEFRPVTDPQSLAAVRRRHGIPDGPYMLYVGRIEPRKNLPGLVAAYEAMRRRMARPPSLVLAGGRDRLFAEFHREMTGRRRVEGLVLAGSVAQEDLPALYSGAAVFAYPSFGEGFGLPVAEAMACGAPVVASTAPAVPEVAGGAALLVDPADTTELAMALTRVLTDPELAATLRARGLSRARELTWDGACVLALAAYEAAFTERRDDPRGI